MKEKQEAALLQYLNTEEEQHTLDPKNICSNITFTSASVSEEEGILYYNFEVELDPEGEQEKTSFSYQPSVLKIMDKEENMHLEFIREFESYFIAWMEQKYYQ